MSFFRSAKPVRASQQSSRAKLRCEQLEDRVTPAAVPGFTESIFANGLTTPTAMTVAPDGRIFVAEKAGTLRVVQNGNVLPTPFVSLSVNTVSERGLIGVVLDPNFATNNFVYVYYTTNATTPVNRVSRFTANGNIAVTGSEVILLDNIPSTNGNHNGGSMLFRPDGKLYIGVGEAGVPANSQVLTNVLGKVLRINSDGSIPSDNLFFNTPGARREIYSLGLRNPFTMAVQPGTGRFFINDVGGARFEEVNEGIAGANYGWPNTEGDFNPASFPQFTRPLVAYAHGTDALQGNSIAGGAFYNPANATFGSDYVGDYFFGEFVRSRIFVRDNTTGAVSTLVDGTMGRGVVDLEVLNDGRLLYLSLINGAIYQITPSTRGQQIAVGTGPGTQSQFAVLNPDGGARFATTAYAGYTGGVRIASGDVTGDGIDDIIAATATGAPPHIKVFDGATGAEIQSFFAFDQTYLGGVFVAAGDVTGDGRADIIVSTATATSHVKVFDARGGALVRSFFAFPGFTGGVTVAAGDVNGDHIADIITGTATGSSHVKAFNGATLAEIASFFAFAPQFAGGITVGVAGNSIVAGATNGPAHVKTFDTSGNTRLSFFAFAPGFLGGVRVSGNGNTLLAGAGLGASPHLKGYDATTGAEVISQLVFDPASIGGIFVG